MFLFRPEEQAWSDFVFTYVLNSRAQAASTSLSMPTGKFPVFNSSNATARDIFNRIVATGQGDHVRI